MIEFDVESTGVQPHSGKQYAFLYCFYDGTDKAALHYSPDDTSNHDEIQAWLDRGAEEGIRAWNSKFDFAFAESAGFTLPPEDSFFDGMIVAHVIDERRSVALKSVAKDLFGDQAADLQKDVKDWLSAERRRRKKESTESGHELIEPNYSDVPTEIIEPYGLEDVILTKKIGDVYDPKVSASKELTELVNFERKVLGALYAVEKRGLPASSQDYRKLENEVVKNLEELEDRCFELAIATEDFNPKSTPKIIQALKDRNADLSFMSEKNGKLSADAENLRAVDDELAKAILDFRGEYKVLSTYVRPMIERHWENSLRSYKEPFISGDGKIHAGYRQLGARTGRMSCSDPNIQNQPRDDLRLRYCIRAEEGKKLVTCDLSNIEMRLFAAYAGEGPLLDAVRAGEDLHLKTAKALGIRDRERAGGVFESARQLGKTYNFSRIYGGGLRTIKRQFRCSMDDARLYRRRFDDAYPEVSRLQDRIEYKLHDQGYIKSMWGRRFRVDPRDSYKAVNYLVQGTAAELLKQALIDCHSEGLPVVGCVHDELIGHIEAEYAEELKERLIFHLTAQARPGGKLWDSVADKQVIPIEADGVVVDRWSDAKPNKDGTVFVPKWAQ